MTAHETFFANLPAGFLERSLRYVNNAASVGRSAQVIVAAFLQSPTHHRAQVHTLASQWAAIRADLRVRRCTGVLARPPIRDTASLTPAAGPRATPRPVRASSRDPIAGSAAHVKRPRSRIRDAVDQTGAQGKRVRIGPRTGARSSTADRGPTAQQGMNLARVRFW